MFEITLPEVKPHGYRDWLKIAKKISEPIAEKMVDALFVSKGESFASHIDFLAIESVSQLPGNCKSLSKRPQLMRLIHALEQHSWEYAAAIAKYQRSQIGDQGASVWGSSPYHSEENEQIGWLQAIAIIQQCV